VPTTTLTVSPVSLPASPTAVYRGAFDESAATRLLWRAGFGPHRGEAAQLAKLGLDGAVASLTRPTGRAQLIGPDPKQANGQPLDPINVWGDAHCWWLDRMVRSDQPLIERMTLVWHSWFATSIESASAQLMLNQNAMMRSHALGNFHDLLVDVTQDPAMLLWLNGSGNTLYDPNENYGREMLELFTLGAGRGYTEEDVHENALALTGFTNDWTNAGPKNFRYEPALHDNRVKRVLGQRGRFDWRDSCRLAVTHASHPSFMVAKLWGYFVGAGIPDTTARELEAAYVSSGFEVRPLIEAILRHPLFYEGPRLVLPPVVFVAGMNRALGQGLQTDAWSWICDQAGQMLFDPPNVSGWDYSVWLDTARWAGRLTAVNTALEKHVLSTDTQDHYPVTETPEQALTAAIDFWGGPQLSAPTIKRLIAYGRRVQRDARASWEQEPYRILRQNGLRALIPMTPDWQTA
jgi:uncharacterized protein (DUF1800 family)